jgi:hypothetical protein
MLRYTAAVLCLVGAFAFAGCDDTKSEHKVETTTPAGTTVKEHEKTVEKPNGTVTQESKKTVERDNAADSKTEVKKTTEKDGDTKIEVEKKN